MPCPVVTRRLLIDDAYRGVSMAMSALILHWVLLFGWGLAFNDQGGYRYCRLTMASVRDVELTPWAFSVGGMLVLILLGRADRWGLKLGVRAAYYPLPLFVATQLFAMWLLEGGIRF